MIRPVLTEVILFLAPFVLYAVFLWATKAGVLDVRSWPLMRVLSFAIAAMLLVLGSFIYSAHFSGAPLLTLPVHGVRISRTGGTNTPDIDAAELAEWIHEANRIYAPASVRLSFDPATGFTDRIDDLLSDTMGSGDADWGATYSAGESLASELVGKVPMPGMVRFYPMRAGRRPEGGHPPPGCGVSAGGHPPALAERLG